MNNSVDQPILLSRLSNNRDQVAVMGLGLLPSVIERAGENPSRRFIEFFTAHIRNPGTRNAYARAVRRFFAWCDMQGLELSDVSPFVVGAYVKALTYQLGAPTVKLHLAAIRMLFDFLVTGQIVPVNPAASVRGPKHVVKMNPIPGHAMLCSVASASNVFQVNALHVLY